MFNTKAKKIEKEEYLKKEKEVQSKVKVNKALSKMKTQIVKLDKFKKDCIEKARKATLVGNIQAYNLSKSGLKMCISKQRLLESLITSTELSIQMSEMNKVIKDFVDGIDTISNDLREVTSFVDITKAQTKYESALSNNVSQYEAMEQFLKEAESGIESFNSNEIDVSDDEIDSLINNQAIESENNLDDEIDSKINMIRNKINQ